MFKMLSIVVAIVVPQSVSALPQINDAPQNIAHGKVVTISGEAFGTKTIAAPAMWEDFEDGVSNGTSLASQNVWTVESNALVEYSTTNLRTPNSQLHVVDEFVYDTNQKGNFHKNVLAATKGKRMVSFWWYFDVVAASSSTTAQLKTFRIAPGPHHSDYIPFSYSVFLNPDRSLGSTYWTSTLYSLWSLRPRAGEWIRSDLLIEDSDVNIDNGAVHVRLTRAGYNKMESKTATKTRTADYPDLQRYIKAGYGLQNAAGGEVHTYWDDIYADNSWARVELCNESVYIEATHCELQIPSSWHKTSVDISVNAGAFAVGDTAYLIVVDQDNVASAGRLVSIGGTDSSAPTLSALGPCGELYCSVGTPTEVTLTVTTNEAASCRYGTQDSTWAQMTTMAQTGGTGHLQSLALDCEASYDYAILCCDAAGNESVAGAITFTTATAELVTDIVLDNTDHNCTRTGTWTSSTHFLNYHGVDYLYSSNSTGDAFTWTTSRLEPGTYDVFAWWTADASRPTDASFVIEHAAGSSTASAIDQSVQGGQWVFLGSYDFGNTGTVTLFDSGTGTGGACADAVRFVAPVNNTDAGLPDSGDMLTDVRRGDVARTADDSGLLDSTQAADRNTIDGRTAADASIAIDAHPIVDAAVSDLMTLPDLYRRDAQPSDVSIVDTPASDVNRTQDALVESDAGADSSVGDGCQCSGSARRTPWGLGVVTVLLVILARRSFARRWAR